MPEGEQEVQGWMQVQSRSQRVLPTRHGIPTAASYGGAGFVLEREQEPEAFVVLYDARDGTEFPIREVDAPRYLAKKIPADEPGAGKPLFTRTPPAEVVVRQRVAPKAAPQKRRRRRRGSRGRK